MQIKPYSKNAKKHDDIQIELIAKSIQRFGWQQPIKCGKDGVIIVGHGRKLAYDKYKDIFNLKEIWAIDEQGNNISGGPETKPLTEEEEIAYRLADNQINALTGFEMKLVQEDLKLLDEPLVKLTGFELKLETDDKDDEIPTVLETRLKLGDVIQMGKHRLIVGDSMKLETYETLLGNQKADIVFTSPPYNIASKMYESNGDGYQDNLSAQGYEDFMVDVLNNCNMFTKGFIFWNISYNKNNKKEYLKTLSNLLDRTGLLFRELITWDKSTAMPITNKSYLTRQSEQIILFSKDETPVFNKTDNSEFTNLWKTKPNKNFLENHKAGYPVELVLKGILSTTKSEDIILEPFSGSGTNIIACEKSGRVCYGIELDPIYADASVQRYVDFVDNPVVLLNGEPTNIWKKKM